MYVYGWNRTGQTAARRMDNQEVIGSYTDQQALNDGVLVDIRRGSLNRVTRAVFDAFTEPMGDPRPIQPVTDVTRLMGVIDTMLRVEPDSEGWRTATVEGKELWMVPNEVNGLTLLFPDDG